MGILNSKYEKKRGEGFFSSPSSLRSLRSPALLERVATRRLLLAQLIPNESNLAEPLGQHS